MAEEDKGYEIIDKRKVKLDENGEAHVQPDQEDAQSVEAGPDQGTGLQDANLPPVDVYSLLKSFISLLGTHTWQWLGLVKDPMTGRMVQDLAQAKVAIDSIAAMASLLEVKLEDSERRELQAMLSDLRINFVQQSSRN